MPCKATITRHNNIPLPFGVRVTSGLVFVLSWNDFDFRFWRSSFGGIAGGPAIKHHLGI